MKPIRKINYFICDSSLHVGAGAGLGYIDNPIQREKHTQFPKIEGSGQKGAIRESFYKNKKSMDEPEIVKLFGPWKDGDNAGAMVFSDARLLFFPVRNIKTVFSWITCPLVLNRWIKEHGELKSTSNIAHLDVANAICSAESCIQENTLILEEYTYTRKTNLIFSIEGIDYTQYFADLFFKNSNDYWHKHFVKNCIILSDYAFQFFVKHHTEVITRNRIEPKSGTADGGALFTIELLPENSILYNQTIANPEFKANGADADSINKLYENGRKSIIQMGGDKSVGKGFIRFLN